MKRPGPPKKPTAIKRLTGNPGGKKLNDREPQPGGLPVMPEGRFDEVGVREWKRLVKVLSRMGCVTEADQGLLEATIFYYALWVKYSKLAQEKPFVKSPKSDYFMISPFVTMAEKAMRHYKELCYQFGLTPASRSNIKVDMPPEEDPVETFRQQGKTLKRVK